MVLDVVLLLNLSRFIKFTVGAVYFRGSVRAESILIGIYWVLIVLHISN